MSQKVDHQLIAITPSKRNWFSKFFHRLKEEQIVNKNRIMYPTTPNVCCCTNFNFPQIVRQHTLGAFCMFYFTCNHIWNWNKIISASEGVLKLFLNYFSDNEHVEKYSRAAISLWDNFEIISGKFPLVEIKLFQMDIDKGWNNFISHVSMA